MTPTHTRAPQVRIGESVLYRGHPYVVTALLPAAAGTAGRVVLLYCGAALVPPDQQDVTVPVEAVRRR